MFRKILLGAAMAAFLAGPAVASTNCTEMFERTEAMIGTKTKLAIGDKVKAYRMAVDGYQMCASARTSDAQKEFDKVFAMLKEIE